MLLADFRRAVVKHGLLAPADRVLAAVSGGPDSVALLRLLLRLAPEIPVTVTVAHVNHGLRGPAADEDEEFVAALARGLDVPFQALRPGESDRRLLRGGGEEAARRVRHALLLGAARRGGCARIALGHTLDDQAETVLLRLLRGAGRRGLSGMAFGGPGRLARPMLGIRRAAVRAWLADLGQPYRTDETNDDARFLRNRIRARLVPLMQELNPAVVEVLARTAEIVAEEDRYLDEIAAHAYGRLARPAAGHGVIVSAQELSALPLPVGRRVARMLLREARGDPRGPRLSAVEALLDLAAPSLTDASRDVAGGATVSRRLDELTVEAASPGRAETGGTDPEPAGARPAGERRGARGRGFHLTLEIPGEVRVPGSDQVLRAHVLSAADAREDSIGSDRVWLDADALGPEVAVRTRLAGDVVHPLGAPGRRKLRDVLIDAKVPRDERGRLPVVVGPAGIAWVVGVRIGHAYRLTSRTRRVAVLERIPAPE